MTSDTLDSLVVEISRLMEHYGLDEPEVKVSGYIEDYVDRFKFKALTLKATVDDKTYTLSEG